jgi:Tfp pilus assembly protein PilF
MSAAPAISAAASVAPAQVASAHEGSESPADAVIAEMVLEAPVPVVMQEAVAPRRVPSPTLVVSPGVQDDFAVGSGVEDQPAAPMRRPQLPPIVVSEPVGTVLQSDLFRFRPASVTPLPAAPQISAPVKPAPVPAAPAPATPEPPASAPAVVAPATMAPEPVSEVEAPAVSPLESVIEPAPHVFDPASEEIRPSEILIPSQPEMEFEMLESLSATHWAPVDFGSGIAPVEGEPATNVISTPVMPSVGELASLDRSRTDAMNVVVAPEPSPLANLSAPISSPLVDAIQPGGTLLGTASPAAAGGSLEAAASPAPASSSPMASSVVPAGASSPSLRSPATGLPSPLYTISIESLRRDLAAEAAAVSPELSVPVSASAPSASSVPPRAGLPGVSAGGDGPQRLTPAASAAAYRQSSADPLISRALGFRKLGMDEQAITAYREALTIDPRNPVVKNNLADLILERGEKIEEAVDLLQEALQEDLADRGPYYSTLGWAYTRLGDYSNAEKFLNEALRAGITAGRLYRRGRLFAAMGMITRARADFDRALVYSEDAATSEMIRTALQEIRSDLPVQGTARNVR